MNPAFPDVVGEWASHQAFEEREDAFFEFLDAAENTNEIADAIIIAAALQEIEATRVW
jgi:hypothetical protein